MAVREFEAIASILDNNAIVFYTECWRLPETKPENDENFQTVPDSCDARWTINEHANVRHGKPLPLWDYVHIVGEVTAIYKALELLEDYRHGDNIVRDSVRCSVHICADSTLRCGWLTRGCTQIFTVTCNACAVVRYVSATSLISTFIGSYITSALLTGSSGPRRKKVTSRSTIIPTKVSATGPFTLAYGARPRDSCMPMNTFFLANPMIARRLFTQYPRELRRPRESLVEDRNRPLGRRRSSTRKKSSRRDVDVCLKTIPTTQPEAACCCPFWHVSWCT